MVTWVLDWDPLLVLTVADKITSDIIPYTVVM